jgi:hypothetical protein
MPYLLVLPERWCSAGTSRTGSFMPRVVAWTGGPWQVLPYDFLRWPAAYGHALGWLAVGVFAAMVRDLRLLLSDLAGRKRSLDSGHSRQLHAAVHS